MITATCKNDDCSQVNVEETLLGNHELVECGVCHQPCELGDHTPDPEVDA